MNNTTGFKTKVSSWGNSYGLRLPKNFVKENSDYLKNAFDVIFDKKNQALVIKPVRAVKTKEYFIKQLKKMKPVSGKELPWGKPVGKEIW